jgi:Contractile injection system tube protein/LysM domain
MALRKLTITPERGAPFNARFNPERYTVTKGVQFAEIGIPGLDSPVLQFVRGQNEKVTMDLFFDTTDHGVNEADVKDVRDLTVKLYALTQVNPETHAPLRVQLSWGMAGPLTSYNMNQRPWLVVESVSQEYMLFNPTGIPVRAKVTTSFREAWKVETQLVNTPRHSSDRTKVRTVKRGETITHVAGAEYQDPRSWRAIADANELENPRFLEPGSIVVVPRNTSEGR